MSAYRVSGNLIGVSSEISVYAECSHHAVDKPRRHVLEQPVEAQESVDLVVSLGHIGSIADLDEMASVFAEISAGGGHYFGRPDSATSERYLGSPTES